MVDPLVQTPFNTVRHGGCACGLVRYSLQGEPLRVALCHCTDCRKTSGSVFVTFGVWPLSALSSQGEVGNWKGREFCLACGGQVFSRQPENGEVELHLGSLDDAPASLAPGYEIWVKRREPWLAAVSNAAQHNEDALPSETASLKPIHCSAAAISASLATVFMLRAVPFLAAGILSLERP